MKALMCSIAVLSAVALVLAGAQSVGPSVPNQKLPGCEVQIEALLLLPSPLVRSRGLVYPARRLGMP